MRNSRCYRLFILAKLGFIIFSFFGILIAFEFFILKMNNNNIQLLQFIIIGGVIVGCFGIGIGLVVQFGLDFIASFLNKMNPGVLPGPVILIGQILGSIEGIIIGYLTLQWIGFGMGAVLGWFVGGCTVTLSRQICQHHISCVSVSFVIGFLIECIGGLIIKHVVMLGAIVPSSRILVILSLSEFFMIAYMIFSKIWRLLKERQ